MTKPYPGRTLAAAREAVVKEALRVVPRQTRGWRKLSIVQQVQLIKAYVDAHYRKGS